MKPIRFEDAFPAVPPMVHARFEEALKETKTMKRAKPISALVLAAILVITLAGVAYAAAQSGVLQFLFHSGERTQEQLDLVQPLGIVHEENGVTTRVTDAILNQGTLSVAFDLESKQPIYIITDSITLNGVELFVSDSSMVNMWYGNEYASQYDTQARGFTGYLEKPSEGENPANQIAYEQAIRRLQEERTGEVKIHLTYLVPQKELVPIAGIYDAQSQKAWKEIDACVAAGNTPIASDDGSILVDSSWLGDQYNEWIPAHQYPVGDAEAHVSHSNMKVLDSFELTLDLAAQDNGIVDKTPVPLQDGRTKITFKEISFTPLQTIFDFTIAPDGMTIEEIQDVFQHFAFYGCFDEENTPKPLQFQDMYYEGETSLAGQPDGSASLHVNYRMPALLKQPQLFMLVPYRTETGEDELLWEYAIYF